jgi:[NiFe] hydrogenase assembly HybE family chaperone
MPERAIVEDPSPRVVAAYRAAEARMAGVPILNPRLAVEAVGFRRWSGHWLGALVTPWCINVVLLPDDPQAWKPPPPGDKRLLAFPAGPYEFISGRDALLGEHQSLSLFSPVLEFEDQNAARIAALAALDALFDEAHFEEREVVRAAEEAQAAALAAPMTKREFLRGHTLNAPGPQGKGET